MTETRVSGPTFITRTAIETKPDRWVCEECGGLWNASHPFEHSGGRPPIPHTAILPGGSGLCHGAIEGFVLAPSTRYTSNDGVERTAEEALIEAALGPARPVSWFLDIVKLPINEIDMAGMVIELYEIHRKGLADAISREGYTAVGQPKTTVSSSPEPGAWLRLTTDAEVVGGRHDR